MAAPDRFEDRVAMAESDRLEDRVAMSEIDSLPPGACTLDHDGCVVCSDAGIPLRIISLEGDDALCEDAAGNRASIAVELVAPVHIGDVLLTHGGVAIGLASRTGEVTDEVCQ